MENNIIFWLEEKNKKWYIWYIKLLSNGRWSIPKQSTECFDTKEEAESEINKQQWNYWSTRFYDIMGELPDTLCNLTGNKLKALVYELENKFKSPNNIPWTGPTGLIISKNVSTEKRHPKFKQYIKIMHKYGAI